MDTQETLPDLEVRETQRILPAHTQDHVAKSGIPVITAKPNLK